VAVANSQVVSKWERLDVQRDDELLRVRLLCCQPHQIDTQADGRSHALKPNQGPRGYCGGGWESLTRRLSVELALDKVMATLLPAVEWPQAVVHLF
jgi:hypothetical protein